MTLPLVLALTLSLAPAASGAADPSAQDRDAGWRSDLEHFVDLARRVHAAPTRPAFSEVFDEAAVELHHAIPELSDDQILGEFMKLAAILNDGHTAVYGPRPDSPLSFEGRMLPLKFYVFPDGLHVVGGQGDWVDLAGRRVVRFGDVAAEEVLRRMSAYRGGDNEMTWTWAGPQFYLPRLAMLRLVGAAGAEAGTVELTLVDREGREETVSVPAGDHEVVRKLRPFPHGSEVPRYLSRVDANYWMEPIPEERALYFQFNQVRDARGETIAAFAERLRTALREQEAATLIVDVRHNNGGNNSLVRPLVRAMIEFEMSAPEHRIYVLMGRNTFSAAQNFLNRVERWTDAVFVGEPSSSSPNFVGEENEFVLPFSRLGGSLSNLYWQDSDPFDRRPWIEPDVSVVLTAEEYYEGFDPVLDRALLHASERELGEGRAR